MTAIQEPGSRLSSDAHPASAFGTPSLQNHEKYISVYENNINISVYKPGGTFFTAPQMDHKMDLQNELHTVTDIKFLFITRTIKRCEKYDLH
jgi:hypothetical protein